MKKLITLLSLTAAALLIAGCDEEFSRYPSVSVPEYGTEDYLRDLSDPNPELVYNAICKLGISAKRFGKTLCAEDADPASAEYQQAEQAYRSICEKLDSEDPLIVAPSLRFLQLFSKEYKPRKELLNAAIGVESNHPQVLFEQVTLLRMLVCKHSQLPEPLLHHLLDNPSWVVSRASYDLIGRLSSEPLRQELLGRYKDTDDERERLLIIVALGQQLEPEEARFFEKEMLETDSPKIRNATGVRLTNNLNCPGVKTWMGDHYQEFSEAERARIFKKTVDFDLTMRFLNMGFIPDDDELEEMAEDFLLIEQAKEEHPQQAEKVKEKNAQLFDQLIRIDQALETAPQLNGRWQVLKEEAKQKHHRINALREELAPVSQEFLENTKALLTKYEMPASEQEKALEKIDKALKAITGE